MKTIRHPMTGTIMIDDEAAAQGDVVLGACLSSAIMRFSPGEVVDRERFNAAYKDVGGKGVVILPEGKGLRAP